MDTNYKVTLLKLFSPYFIILFLILISIIIPPLGYLLGFTLFPFLYNNLPGLLLQFVYILFSLYKLYRIRSFRSISIKKLSDKIIIFSLEMLLVIFTILIGIGLFYSVRFFSPLYFGQFTNRNVDAALVEYENIENSDGTYTFDYSLRLSNISTASERYEMYLELKDQQQNNTIEFGPRLDFVFQKQDDTKWKVTIKNARDDYAQAPREFIIDNPNMMITDSFKYRLYTNSWADRRPNVLTVAFKQCWGDCFTQYKYILEKNIAL